MADPLLYPDNNAAQLRDLEQRVRTLESVNRLLSSSILGGTLKVLDASGGRIAEIGSLFGGTTDGLVVYAADHVTAVLDADRVQGFASPWLGEAWQDPAESHVITTPTFATTWQTETELMWATQILFRVPCFTDAGTTGEIRLVAAGGATATAVKTIPANTASLFFECRWAHGLTIGTGPIFFSLDARRASGAGNFTVFKPYPLHLGANMGTVVGGWV